MYVWPMGYSLYHAREIYVWPVATTAVLDQRPRTNHCRWPRPSRSNTIINLFLPITIIDYLPGDNMIRSAIYVLALFLVVGCFCRPQDDKPIKKDDGIKLPDSTTPNNRMSRLQKPSQGKQIEIFNKKITPFYFEIFHVYYTNKYEYII